MGLLYLYLLGAFLPVPVCLPSVYIHWKCFYFKTDIVCTSEAQYIRMGNKTCRSQNFKPQFAVMLRGFVVRVNGWQCSDPL